MKDPLASIIIPVYNTAEPVRELVNSINDQTYKNLEIILVNDGSTDDSQKVLRELAKKDDRIKVIAKQNGGASSARNLGLKSVTGKYVCFVDSDDDLAPDFIKVLVSAMEENQGAKTAVVGCHLRRLKEGVSFDEFTTPPHKPKFNDSHAEYILKLLLCNDGRFYAVTNKIFLNDVIKKANLEFDTKMDFAEDTKFLLDYLKHAYGDINIRVQDIPSENYFYHDIAFISRALYIYNFGTDTSTVKQSALKWKNWQASFNHLKSWIGPHPTRKEESLLRKIYLRWKISHALSVARSDLSKSQKLKILSRPKLFLANLAVKFRR